MAKFHPVCWKIVGNGYHRPLIWQQSFCAKKLSSFLLQNRVGGLFNKKSHIIISRMLSWIQKVQFCDIFTKNMVVRAYIRLKNWRWSSNAKKWVLFSSKKCWGIFSTFFSTYSYPTSLVEYKKCTIFWHFE